MQYDNGKVFVGGISWDTNEERLKEYFSSFGEVVEAVIMKDRNTGRARGFGFVVFADPSIAERVTKEKHSIDGKMVEAKKAVPRDDQNVFSRTSNSPIPCSPGLGRTKKIFVGGLASTVTESNFKQYFDQFGTITDVIVMYDHNTQRPRGFGFITYDSENAVENVLMQTYHELNGKMVEVKRAIPKELSPGPSRSPLGDYRYGLGRVDSFLSGYNQGYAPGTIGGYGLRLDGRFSPISGGHSGFPPFGSSYGMGLNFEQALSRGYGGRANFSNNFSYGRGMSPYYIGNSSRFPGPVRYGVGSGGSSSFFSSVTRNLWGNGSLNSSANSSSSTAYIGSGSESIGGIGNSGVNWDSSALTTQGRRNNFPCYNVITNYGSGESNSALDASAGAYGRNIGDNIARTSSYGGSTGSFDGAFADIYGGQYEEPMWKSSNSERDGPSSFGYGLGDAPSDGSAKNSEYVGGYSSVNNRQPNRGNC